MFLNKDEITTYKEFNLLDIIPNEDELKSLLDKLSYLKSTSKKISIKNVNLKDKRQHEGIFYIDEDENVISNFSCALSGKILLQGKLYITNKKIVFYSWFNNSTLFGKTLIEIPKEDIVEVERHKNMLFDNMIIIKTKNTQFLFASFINREKCYSLIKVYYGEVSFNDKASDKNSEKDDTRRKATMMNMSPNRDGMERELRADELNTSNITDNDNFIKSKSKSLLNTPKKNSLNKLENKLMSGSENILNFENNFNKVLPSDTVISSEDVHLTYAQKYKKILDKHNFKSKLNNLNKSRLNSFYSQNKRNFQNVIIKEHTFGDVPLSLIYQSLYNNDNICVELGKNKNFISSYLEIRQDYGLTTNIIDPENFIRNIPKYISNENDYIFTIWDGEQNLIKFINDEFGDASNYSKIEFKCIYTHPILKKKLMGPSKLNVEDQFKIYFISPMCMIVEIFSYMSGFMLMDTFYSVLQYKYDTDYKYDANSGKMNIILLLL